MKTMSNPSPVYYTSLQPGTYTSPAALPGFVIGIVDGTEQSGFGWVAANCGPLQAVASGGQTAISANVVEETQTSFTLPVPPNASFTLSQNYNSNLPGTPSMEFYWYCGFPAAPGNLPTKASS